jgi:hypothetical protein
MKKAKKKLTLSEEFEIMKMVLDKFLWISTIVLIYGIYLIITQGDIVSGFYFFITSIIILMLFMILLVKEYEVSK